MASEITQNDTIVCIAFPSIYNILSMYKSWIKPNEKRALTCAADVIEFLATNISISEPIISMEYGRITDDIHSEIVLKWLKPIDIFLYFTGDGHYTLGYDVTKPHPKPIKISNGELPVSDTIKKLMYNKSNLH